MKLIITIAFLTRLAFAQKYAAGDACHTNIECNNNCVNSQWTVANQDGEYAFVCDPDLADGTLWWVGSCDKTILAAQVIDREKTASVCNDFCGALCRFGCAFSGSSRTPSDTIAAWEQGCADAGTQLNSITSGASEEDARMDAGCRIEGDDTALSSSGSRSLFIGRGAWRAADESYELTAPVTKELTLIASKSLRTLSFASDRLSKQDDPIC